MYFGDLTPEIYFNSVEADDDVLDDDVEHLNLFLNNPSLRHLLSPH